MPDASRAIIIENDQMLLMRRNKDGSQYFTLVGGRKEDDETVEQCLIREVREETGLEIKEYRQVYFEPHKSPYNNQHIFVCTVQSHSEIKLQEWSEEAQLNNKQFVDNTHTPMWVALSSFSNLAFRTPQLHDEIKKALKKRFPKSITTLK
jgi:ADP-ribose pyrophosphatase YjhB (NUDIX family)